MPGGRVSPGISSCPIRFFASPLTANSLTKSAILSDDFADFV